MNDLTLPGILILCWLLAVVALWRPRREVGVVAVGVGAGGVGFASLGLKGEPALLAGLLLAGGGGVAAWAWMRRRRLSPSLEELALLADFLSHRLLGGSNLGQALSQAGQEACREPPTLPLPLLGPYLARVGRVMATGTPEAQALGELGGGFDDPTVQSFFIFLASMAQYVEQSQLADALEGMAIRVRTYQELDTSFRSRLTTARTTRLVMLLLVPGLLYVIAFHSPLGLLDSPLGVPLLVFDAMMLGLAVLVGNQLSQLPGLEF